MHYRIDPLYKKAAHTLIGNNIRKYRIKRCITIKELAHRLGCIPQTISYIETGRTGVNFSFLCMISEALGTPIDHFYDDVKNIRSTKEDIACA